MKFRIIESDVTGNYGLLLRDNKKFWIGTVNVLDGYIEEVYTDEESSEADRHHSLYWSEEQIEKFRDEEVMPFWISNKGLEFEWTTGKVPPHIVREIKKQIKILV